MTGITASQVGALPITGGAPTGNVRVQGNLSLDTTYATARPFNAVAVSAGGNAFSYCSIDGCVYLDGPDAGATAAIDHQRAALLVSAVTSDDGHSQENTLGLETTIQTGAKTAWMPGINYAAGANVSTSASLIYRAEAACASGTTAPAGYGTGIADGTCRWDWINGGALDAKVGFYNAVRVKQGAGPAWGSAENVVIEAGPLQNGVTQKELDITNLGPAAAIGTPPIFGLNIGLGGNGVTAGLQVGASGANASNPGALFGAWFTGPYLASIAVLEVDTSSPITFRDTGSHANGIDLGGATYSGAQVVGKGWTVDPQGNISGVGYRETLMTPASSSTPCTAGQFADDPNYHYVCVAPNKWRRATLSDF